MERFIMARIISSNFPAPSLFESKGIRIPRSFFPSIRVRTYVHCTFPPASASFKPRLLDVGSCFIPSGFTIVKEQWDQQQKKGINDAYWCGFVVSSRSS